MLHVLGIVNIFMAGANGAAALHCLSERSERGWMFLVLCFVTLCLGLTVI